VLPGGLEELDQAPPGCAPGGAPGKHHQLAAARFDNPSGVIDDADALDDSCVPGAGNQGQIERGIPTQDGIDAHPAIMP
jgi:hypothetical protein